MTAGGENRTSSCTGRFSQPAFQFNHMTVRLILLNCCFVICFLYPTCTYAQADEVSRSWNQPVKPYRIIGNIYYVGASEVTSFLIVTPKGHILLDSGFFETVPEIKQNVAELGFRLEDIKVLINSHAHYDHAGGFALLKALTGAKLMATQADAELLARGGKGDFHFGDRLSYPAATTDRILRDGDRVELGDVMMTAHLTPGHTKGCTTWTMKVKEHLKSYDVVFVGSTTVPGYNLVDNTQYPTITADYERTFRVLRNLPCDVFLASHGSFYSMQEKSKLLAQGRGRNPFIDPRGYRRFIAQTEKAFRQDLRRQEKARANGRSARRIRLEIPCEAL
jgi:metallo-beta-lactamase class B